jgi:solute carrier family 8 (sodium/calcium exchanger)
MPLGNLAVAAGILFSGSSPVKGMNIFRHIHIPMIGVRTYYLAQASYLIPSISLLWGRKQEELLQQLQGKEIKLGGDGRCCSPGHTAKYGSYTLMDLTQAKVLDMQLIQVGLTYHWYIQIQNYLLALDK